MEHAAAAAAGGGEAADGGSEAVAAADKRIDGQAEDACSEAWTIQHLLLPAIRRSYEPPSAQASNGSVVQVACTEMLYKIFERC